MRIKTYVITWNAVRPGLDSILSQIDNYDVINSDAPEQYEWHNLGLVWYYNQVKYALNNFISKTNDDIFCLITGDISSDSFKDIYNKATRLMQNEYIGLYSPNLTYEPWTMERCYVDIYPYEKFSYISCQTEGVFFFMKREVAEEMHLFMEQLSKDFNLYDMKSGWGLDYVWCAISLINKKLIIRDSEYIVNHPAGSSYDHADAQKEKIDVTDYFINVYLKDNKQQVIDFFNTLDNRVNRR